jgi:CheY-like chemotaxis protein
MTLNNRILFVDDDENILASFKRNLRNKYDITTISSPLEALQVIKKNIKKPFAVIVSDLKMPKMDGLEFLSNAKIISKSSIRVMLTGYADVDNAIAAINEGNIFRFLIKPCPPYELIKVLNACLEQYKLIKAEKELLMGTLQGSIKLLTDILSLSNREAFSRGERIKNTVKQILLHYPVKDAWQIEIAAMLSQIGCFALPEDILSKVIKNQPLNEEEEKLFKNHPKIGSSLVKNIPRLEMIAKMIYLQNLDKETTAPEGAKIINLAIYYDKMMQSGHNIHQIMTELNNKVSLYGSKLIKALELAVGTTDGYLKRSLYIKELKESMRLDEDVLTIDNLLLLKKGQELNQASITRLQNYGKSCGVKEPIKVLIPKNL